jgi:hypothetical protein
MNRKTTLAAIGGYQPLVFCAGMYIVALFFSIFICSAIFHAVNHKQNFAQQEETTPAGKTAMVSTGQPILLTVSK